MCGFIAQLVEHRTRMAEVKGSNPVEALIFFRLLLSHCLNWKIYCDDHSSLSKNSSNAQKRTVLLCYIRFKRDVRFALMRNCYLSAGSRQTVMFSISRQKMVIQPIKFTNAQQTTNSKFILKLISINLPQSIVNP